MYNCICLVLEGHFRMGLCMVMTSQEDFGKLNTVVISVDVVVLSLKPQMVVLTFLCVCGFTNDITWKLITFRFEFWREPG